MLYYKVTDTCRQVVLSKHPNEQALYSLLCTANKSYYNCIAIIINKIFDADGPILPPPRYHHHDTDDDATRI
jgi:hypothetical protein